MEKLNYKISSKTVLIIGEESNSCVDFAFVELIKNSYDANSLFCFLFFDLENDSIYIIDNGIGMSKKNIENNWMIIGESSKKLIFHNDDSRKILGEKGIGRFSLNRIGNKCEMLTKNFDDKLIFWSIDWTSFNETGKNLDEITADFQYLNDSFVSQIPLKIYSQLLQINKSYDLNTGTILKISNLKDNWNNYFIKKLVESLSNLVSKNKNFNIIFQYNELKKPILIQKEEFFNFDYKISAFFDGEKFDIQLNRNEFDLNKIPEKLFQMNEFKNFPYRKIDFENKIMNFSFQISDFIQGDLELIKKIGSFEFEYIFKKSHLDDKKFYFKENKQTTESDMGINIYRDNFLVNHFNNLDWLSLGELYEFSSGKILISRENNKFIIDKSNRDGIIENIYFSVLKNIILKFIEIFEKDRKYILSAINKFNDKENNKNSTIEDGKNIAKLVLSDKLVSSKSQVETLANTVELFEEERKELLSEIKLLRTFATNGMITTALIHDLTGINALLVNRVETFELAIKKNKSDLITRSLTDLKKSDIFLKSWISVVTSQIKKDKRFRIRKKVYKVIYEILDLLNPILNLKQIKVSISDDGNDFDKNIFVSDFETIIYNLIINSIESFEQSDISSRKINIFMESKNDFNFHYKDNGKGISKSFKNPYDIFDFGTTSKFDKNGKLIGTGIGMYIVSSTILEYNGKYEIVNSKSGFNLKVTLPK